MWPLPLFCTAFPLMNLAWAWWDDSIVSLGRRPDDGSWATYTRRDDPADFWGGVLLSACAAAFLLATTADFWLQKV